MANEFIRENIFGAGANGVRTENGAVSYATAGKEVEKAQHFVFPSTFV